MKNKRTRLTALALSALMAVSTISSVTWAADMFSDGSEAAEVQVEEHVVVSDVEDEDTADDVAKTGVSVSDVTDVTFKKDTSGEVIAVFTLTSGSGSSTLQVKATKGASTPATCFAPEMALYSATDDSLTFTVVSNGDIISDNIADKGTKYTQDIVDSSCNTWSGTDGSHNIKTDSPLGYSKGYIVVPGSVSKSGIIGHKVIDPYDTSTGSFSGEGVEVVLKNADDQNIGKKAFYRGCSVCGMILPTSTDERDQSFSDKTYKTTLENLKKEDLNSNSLVNGKWLSLGSINTNECYIQDIGTNDHNYDTEHPVIIYDNYNSTSKEHTDGSSDPLSSTYSTYARYSSYNVERSGDYSSIEDFKPRMCHYENGEMVADDPESPYDAYYFKIVVCKNCPTIKFWDKIYLKDVNGYVDGTYYEKVEEGNIIGFFGSDRSKTYFFSSAEKVYVPKADGTTVEYKNYNTLNGKVRTDGKIPSSFLSDPPEPIFEKCGKTGYYYVRTYVQDTPEAVTSERKEIKNSHSWGAEQIISNGEKFTDGTVSQTEDKKLFSTKINKGFALPAKSIDCITTAKYQVGRVCINCGTILKVGDLQTVGPNTDRHEYGPYSTFTDPEDDRYVMIDKESHTRYTYVHRICAKCGYRDKKLDDEFIEAHRFTETKIVDGSKKDPTCGEEGYYTVRLVCKCTLEDEGSEKREIIPATDKHDFTGNDVQLNIKDNIQITKDGKFMGEDLPYNVYAEVVRKCINCDEYDSNGINNTPVGSVGVDNDLRIDTVKEGRTVEITEDAKTDANGIPYSCSAGRATITFAWSGKVDGVTVRLDPKTVVVPYYPSMDAFKARTDHKPVTRTEIVKKPTTTQEGSAIEITECSVCKEELSRKDVPIAKLGSAPSVKATTVNYNTVAVTWDAVEGAESYKVYNKSNALGISKWQVVATVNGTSYTDTGLVTGAKYRYTVRPVVEGVLGEYSKKGVLVCPKLTAPEIKSVTAVSTNKNKITWTKVDGASGYIVQRKTADGSWIRIATVRGGSNINCRDKKAVAGASYRVRAFRTVEKPNFVKSNVYGPFSTAK